MPKAGLHHVTSSPTHGPAFTQFFPEISGSDDVDTVLNASQLAKPTWTRQVKNLLEEKRRRRKTKKELKN